MELTLELYDRIVNTDLLVRRITICANRIVPASQEEQKESYQQMDLFSMMNQQETDEATQSDEKEKKLQQAVLDIKKKYGKNAVLRGMNFQEGATARDRNRQIGGHKA